MKKINGLDVIIMVDDDDATNFIHKRVIQKSEIEVDVLVRNKGSEVLQYLKEVYDKHTMSEIKKGIILLDLNMPGMDGWDFIKEFKKLPGPLRNKFFIVMLTSSFSPKDKDHATANSEIDFFIKKPLTLEEFEKSIIPSFCEQIG